MDLGRVSRVIDENAHVIRRGVELRNIGGKEHGDAGRNLRQARDGERDLFFAFSILRRHDELYGVPDFLVLLLRHFRVIEDFALFGRGFAFFDFDMAVFWPHRHESEFVRGCEHEPLLNDLRVFHAVHRCNVLLNFVREFFGPRGD